MNDIIPKCFEQLCKDNDIDFGIGRDKSNTGILIMFRKNDKMSTFFIDDKDLYICNLDYIRNGIHATLDRLMKGTNEND